MKNLAAIFLFISICFYCNDIFANPVKRTLSDTACKDDALLIAYDSALDSIFSFFGSVKNNLARNDWTNFMDDLQKDSVEDAFERCGNLKNELKEKYTGFHNNLAIAMNNLWASLSSNDNLSDAEKNQLIIDKLNCYADNISSSRLAPDGIGGGVEFDPCWNTYNSCKRAAKRARNSGLWGCYLGGLGIAVASGGLGLGLGVSCITIVNIDYNEALEDCLNDLNNCLGN